MTTSWAEEVWKDIPGYEGKYQASNLGRLRSKERGLLSPFLSRGGYLVATVQKQGKRYGTGVHRLVALAFIPNPEQKPEINHKNGNRTDNRPENLEWCTSSENNTHRRRILHGGGGRPERAVVCLTTGEQFPSLTAAANATGAPLCKILVCCQGKRKHTKGLAWAYAEEVQTCAH